MGMFIGLVLIGMGAWTAAGMATTHGIEEPKYSVVEKRDGYEIREYAPYIRAEVEVSGAFKETQNQGFREVAGYIFGSNTSKLKVAMTAPVLHEPTAQDTYLLAFIMPGEYTMESLPVPLNERVKLREMPAQRFAVKRFGGFAQERKVARRTEQLMDALKRDGVITTGEPILAQYDPPWNPPFIRRNEIQVQISQ